MIKLNSPIKPDIKKLTNYLKTINDNGWYTNYGPLHNEFKDKLESYLGVKNLLLINNGTVALQVAGRVLNASNIITTPFSFAATSSAFASQKDNLYFADVCSDTFNLNPYEVDKVIENVKDIDTIVATHVYGNSCNVELFNQIQQKNNVKLIYDAAHCFGVKVNNKSILQYGDASVLSFHATKVFHSIEGGAIVFKSEDDYLSAREYINFGINPNLGTLNPMGVNGKMNEYQAAVGLVNLDVVDDYISRRSELFSLYRYKLKDFVEMPIWHNNCSENGAYMPIKVKDQLQLNYLINGLKEKGIESRQYFTPSLDKIYHSSYNSELPISHQLASSVLCLPLHGNMTCSDVEYVTENVKNLL